MQFQRFSITISEGGEGEKKVNPISIFSVYNKIYRRMILKL
jgi:hypothetical protein